ncbi:tetratricopeptide repeat protein 36-like isoform X2 [Saccoglossus kowalevskii]|uniref:Tetratricopeptide repeat protein 36-like isoform 2 n=1 Tax=Saccoglossus kowalevskii TaxID=10224 RepID=A0ABM0GQ15_SACKO|nr:PREDICTED: tetratricopeptide repeat protein 36-like isoform 2 [Saccoglossus kowalevskii]
MSNTQQESVPSRVIEEETEITKESKRLEICGVKSAESGDLNSALDYFSQAIEVAPLRASGYNNRAQGLRLKGDVQGAILDLDKAVELSGGKGKVACQAYTQRALIRRLEGQNELALEDFKSASSLGSEFARSQVIQLNPYAAMCNKMLSEVVTKLRNGEYLDS